jgi:hypothetical protein
MEMLRCLVRDIVVIPNKLVFNIFDLPRWESVRNSVKIGSPGRTRTCDQPVNSRLLYQLSYRGMKRRTNISILAKPE